MWLGQRNQRFTINFHSTRSPITTSATGPGYSLYPGTVTKYSNTCGYHRQSMKTTLPVQPQPAAVPTTQTPAHGNTPTSFGGRPSPSSGVATLNEAAIAGGGVDCFNPSTHSNAGPTAPQSETHFHVHSHSFIEREDPTGRKTQKRTNLR